LPSPRARAASATLSLLGHGGQGRGVRECGIEVAARERVLSDARLGFSVCGGARESRLACSAWFARVTN
jgi:hypothetical protein